MRTTIISVGATPLFAITLAAMSVACAGDQDGDDPTHDGPAAEAGRLGGWDDGYGSYDGGEHDDDGKEDDGEHDDDGKEDDGEHDDDGKEDDGGEHDDDGKEDDGGEHDGGEDDCDEDGGEPDVCAIGHTDDRCDVCMKRSCCEELEACLADETCVCSLECAERGLDPAHCVGECGGAWGTSRFAHLIACTWKADCMCPHWSDAGNHLI